MFLHLPFVFIHLCYFLQKLVHLLNDCGRVENLHSSAKTTYPTKERVGRLYADGHGKMIVSIRYQHHIFAEAVNNYIGKRIDTTQFYRVFLFRFYEHIENRTLVFVQIHFVKSLFALAFFREHRYFFHSVNAKCAKVLFLAHIGIEVIIAVVPLERVGADNRKK